MGEHVYPVLQDLRIIQVRFSEIDDDYGCLCTFPYDCEDNPDYIDIETVRDLAILGASIAYIVNYGVGKEYFFIPGDVPEWIRQGIDRALRYKTHLGP